MGDLELADRILAAIRTAAPAPSLFDADRTARRVGAVLTEQDIMIARDLANSEARGGEGVLIRQRSGRGRTLREAAVCDAV